MPKGGFSIEDADAEETICYINRATDLMIQFAPYTQPFAKICITVFALGRSKMKTGCLKQTNHSKM